MDENASIAALESVGSPTGHAQLVDLNAIVSIRWASLAGQLAAIFIVFSNVGLSIGLSLALFVVAIAAGLNGRQAIVLKKRATRWISDDAARRQLLADTFLITLILAVTGGLKNPFAAFILVPVTVSAATLSRRSTVGIAIIVVICITALTLLRLPLPWGEPAIVLPLFYVGALWAALVLATLFIAIYVSETAEARRDIERAFAQTQILLTREQSMSALGSLAAAAAHELGTPLSTIAVISKDMSKELPKDHALYSDAQLLLSESERCRDILSKLSQRDSVAEFGQEDRQSPTFSMPVEALLRLSAKPFDNDRIAFVYESFPFDGDLSSNSNFDQPIVQRTAGLTQGLGNLLQNAAQFADEIVRVTARWNAQNIVVTIDDDGPGFAPNIIESLGDTLSPSRPFGQKGRTFVVEGNEITETGPTSMGIGIFIAKSLLLQAGAGLSFSNRLSVDGQSIEGARVEIVWQRPKS